MHAIRSMLREVIASPDSANETIHALLERYGSPVVEEGTATFFLRGEFDAVFLVHWVFGLESRIPYQHVPHTDLWMLPIDLPEGGRIEYKIEVHHHGQTRWIKDPFNPHKAVDPFGANSVCRMNGYADPGWVDPNPDARPGTMDGLVVTSSAFGDDREVKLWLPHEYKAHKRYRLLVVHDGDDYLAYTGMQTVLENLVHRHEIMPLVVAFTSGHQRNEEYGANPLHARFITEDLLPAVRSAVRISDDPADRCLMGASFGGVATLYTAWNHPGHFGKLFCQSGSFVFTDIGHHGRSELWDPVVDFINDFRTDPARIDARLFLSCGVFESLISYNRSLVPLLRDAGVHHRFVESRDGHNWICWRDHMRAGLTWLFPGHLWMTYD